MPSSHQPDVATERRAQIIEAALSCFSRKGYNNTTMDDSVTESGLSKGTLYWDFDSKDDLFIAAATSALEAYGFEALETLAQCETATEKLYALSDEMVKLGTEAAGVFNLFVEFLTKSPQREEAGRFWLEMLADYQQAVVSIVEEGVRSGEFRPVDADALVWAILAAYDGLAVYAMLTSGIDLRRISQTFIDTVIQGLQPAPESDRVNQRETDR